ncbi:MAG: hypothetical protein JW902_14720 [Syntrophaceae bacterium]|nr:hypothetical protein [Syntrophaceae bacterium]
MNIQLLLIIQIVVEVILFGAVVFLLIQGMGRGRREPVKPLLEKTDLEQLKALLDESRSEFQNFEEALAQGRKTLLDLIRRVDEREKTLNKLLAEAEKKFEHQKAAELAGNPEENLRYKDVAVLIRQGMADQEIARECGVTEGEVALIKGLLNAGNEPR